MDWKEANPGDAAALADLALSSVEADAGVEQARAFLRSWRVDLAVEHGVATAAVGVLPPSPGHRRGYGAWWHRGHDRADRWHQILDHLGTLAAMVADLDVLQVSVLSEDTATASRLAAAGFRPAFPLWTMTHDSTTWPDPPPSLPAPLQPARWADADLRSCHQAYARAYEDQRPVEPHTAQTWAQLTAEASFAAAPARLAVSPSGPVIGSVLGFQASHGGIELGPIGTVPEWRHQGVSSALLSSVLLHCRDHRIAPITLTVDGESPTGAQRLYERLGFDQTETLTAFHQHVMPSCGDP